MNATRTCSMDGCEGRHQARGLCSRHYTQKWKAEHPRPPGPRSLTPMQRLLGRIDTSGPITFGGEPCWRFTGATDMGYARIRADGVLVRAHRYIYEQLVGPIPAGLDVDHRCHDPLLCLGGSSCPHRACVNPAHLEPVTRQVNVIRGRGNGNRYLTHCRRGHEFTLENTYWHTGGTKRMCRECKRITDEKKKRAA